MLNKKGLGISAMEAKISLKAMHVIIGYIFATNLMVRLFFAFVGPTSARWNAFIPRKGFIQSLQVYRQSLKLATPQQFIGHNPLGKLAVSAIFALLIVLMSSGLIRAGTDIYYPPFGAMIQGYIANLEVDSATIKPYQDKGVNQEKLSVVKAFKSPIGKIHLYAAYLLMGLIILHISAVIYSEVTEKNQLISAMFSGDKILSEKPIDEHDPS
jgi:cytochrome b